MHHKFDEKDFYNFAGILYELYNGTDPSDVPSGAYRTIISRAYYGAFLNAREKANITDTGGSVHRHVREHYTERNPSIASRLMDLAKLRQDADYDIEKNLGKRDATKSLQLAKKILDGLI